MRGLFLIVVLCVSGCATNSVSTIQSGDGKLRKMTNQIITDGGAIKYADYWHTFLTSTQIYNSKSENDRLIQTLSDIDSKVKTCEAIDWDSVFERYVFALKSHLAAIDCYQKLGLFEEKEKHEKILDFILQGILKSNSGKYFFDAYVVPTWGDAEDLLDIAGYKIIDSYFEFKNNRSYLYRVYLVEDAETGRSREIYFDINEYLQSYLGYQYPFAGIQDALYEKVVIPLKETDFAAKLAMADIYAYKKDYKNAERAYLEAISLGSVKANVELGKMCLAGNSTKFSKSECAQLFVAAASDDFHPAKIFLAYMMYEGIGVEKDKALANELLLDAAKKMEPGEAYFQISKLYDNGRYAAKNSELANEYLHKAASLGSMNAEFLLVFEAFKSLADSQKKEKVFSAVNSSLVKLAKRGHPIAQYLLADFFGDKLSPEQRLSWYQQAASLNLPGALLKLAEVYRWGQLNQTADIKKAREFYLRAANRGHLEAQFQMGWFETEGSFGKVNYQQALLWYLLCSRSGNNDCVTNMGYMYENGYGVDKDYKQAISFYDVAAKQNFPRALYNLGQMHYWGRGFDKNLAEALPYYKSAAEKGFSDAQNKLGLYYLRGEVVPIDYEIARSWFEKAAKQNNEFAFYNLGEINMNGWGVTKNPKLALDYYKKAADRGHSNSMLKLAEAYEIGVLIPKNIDLAVEYYLKAAMNGKRSAAPHYLTLCSLSSNGCEVSNFRYVN